MFIIKGSIALVGPSGATVVFAEDVAHVSGDYGVMSLAVRTDAGTALAGTTGDYIPLTTDALGRLWVAGAYDEDAAHASGDRGIQVLAVQDLDTVAAALAGTAGDYAPLQVDSAGRLFTNAQLFDSLGNAIANTTTTGLRVGLHGASETVGDAEANAFAGVTNYPGNAIRFRTRPQWYNGTTWDLPRSGAVANVAAATGFLDVLSVGRYNAVLPTITENQYNHIQLDVGGRLYVTGSYAEDAVHVSGDLGHQVLAVQDADTVAAALAGLAGDYAPLQVDSSGRLFTNAQLFTSAGAALSVAQANGGGNGGSSNLAVTSMVWNASSDARQQYSSGAVADATTGVNTSAVSDMDFNSTTWDRRRNNTEGTVLASAARTATTNSADLVNYNGRGVRVRINVSALVTAPSITVAIQEKDSISGNYVSILTSAAITTIAQAVTLVLYPGATGIASQVLGQPLPRTWRVAVTHANADSITYSIDYALTL